MAKKSNVSGGSDLDDLSIRNAEDPSLGLTNVADRNPEDWAANTGPTRTGESSGGLGWDPLRSQRRSSSDELPVREAEAPTDLQGCLIAELQDLYQAESEQKRLLSTMAEAASAEELKSAFQDHLEETQQQVARLGQVLELIGEVPGGAGSLPAAVAGLIAELNEKIEMQDPGLRDLMLIAEAQKMEHNEMASYGTARAMAHTLGRDQEAHLLQATLTEEEQADQKLSRIALKLMKQAG